MSQPNSAVAMKWLSNGDLQALEDLMHSVCYWLVLTVANIQSMLDCFINMITVLYTLKIKGLKLFKRIFHYILVAYFLNLKLHFIAT